MARAPQFLLIFHQEDRFLVLRESPARFPASAASEAIGGSALGRKISNVVPLPGAVSRECGRHFGG